MKSREIKVETATYITVYEAISRGLWVFVAILKNNTRQLTITYYKPGRRVQCQFLEQCLPLTCKLDEYYQRLYADQVSWWSSSSGGVSDVDRSRCAFITHKHPIYGSKPPGRQIWSSCGGPSPSDNFYDCGVTYFLASGKKAIVHSVSPCVYTLPVRQPPLISVKRRQLRHQWRQYLFVL